MMEASHSNSLLNFSMTAVTLSESFPKHSGPQSPAHALGGTPPSWYTPVLKALLTGNDVGDERFEEVFAWLLDPNHEPGDAMALLVGLAMRGERADDFVRGARHLRKKMLPWDLGTDLVDTCGTGGDGAGTFNISTTVGLVLAACGLKIVKHGNRAQSGTSGSTDLLGFWQIGFPDDQALAAKMLAECGIVFCQAPKHHPALGALAPVRKRLGIRTLFNGLGPLCNPASPTSQIIGIGFSEWLEPYSQAVAALGAKRALVMHGSDGLDEISLGAPTEVRLIRDGKCESLAWTHRDFGLPAHDRSVFRVSSVRESAEMAQAAISGDDNAPRHILLANCAAGLWLTGRCRDLKEGVAQAAAAIDAGKPRAILERLRILCPHKA